MGDGSAIEWTDATWNPTRGCSRVSPGCGGPGRGGGCYAEGVAARFSDPGQPYFGFAERGRSGSKWTGKVALIPAMLTLPLRWKRPRRIFVNSMSDLFHEALSDAEIDQVFAVMALCPQHTFQVLTKRSERMRDYLTALERLDRIDAAMDAVAPAHWCAREIEKWPLPNIWLGVSVEDQARADERIPLLLETPAAVRFLSCEPLLSALDIRWAVSRNRLDIGAGFLMRGRFSPGLETLRPLDWVICGGESGPRARPMHPDWARSLRDQCADDGAPFFFKQWGEWLPTSEDDSEISYGRHERHGWAVDGRHEAWAYRVGKARAGRLLDGRTHDEMPR